MIFGKRKRSRTERTAALSFDEPKGKAHNQWRLMLIFSVGWVPPLPHTLTLSKTWGSCNVWWGGREIGWIFRNGIFLLKSRLSFSY
jgi:hypothetical protein